MSRAARWCRRPSARDVARLASTLACATLAACTSLHVSATPTDATASDLAADVGCASDVTHDDARCGVVASDAATLDAVSLDVDASRPAVLIGWWRAEGNSDDELHQLSATAEGRPPDYVPGRDGGHAVAFRGVEGLRPATQGYWRVGYAPRAQLSQWSITAWVYLPHNAPDQYQTIVANESRSSTPYNDRNYWFGVTDTVYCGHRIINMGFSSGGAVPEYFNPDTVCRLSTFPVAEWHHVAATYDGVTIVYYLNGLRDGSAPVPVAPDRTTRQVLSIGATNAGANVAWLDVDELRLFDGVLTADEVLADAQ